MAFAHALALIFCRVFTLESRYAVLDVASYGLSCPATVSCVLWTLGMKEMSLKFCLYNFVATRCLKDLSRFLLAEAVSKRMPLLEAFLQHEPSDLLASAETTREGPGRSKAALPLEGDLAQLLDWDPLIESF